MPRHASSAQNDRRTPWTASHRERACQNRGLVGSQASTFVDGSDFVRSPGRYKYSFVFLCFVGLAFLLPAPAAASFYRVGDVVVGESYNAFSKSWMKRSFSIWVGVATSGDEELAFEADTGLGEANIVPLPPTPRDIQRKENLLGPH